MQAGKRGREGVLKTMADKRGKQRVEAKLKSSRHARESRSQSKKGALRELLED